MADESHKEKLPIDNDNRLRVHLVPPPSGDNPWRTKEEYREEREKMLRLQQEQIDALDDLRKAGWRQTIAIILTLIATVAAVVGTCISVMNYFDDKIMINEQPVSNKQ